MFGVRCSRFRFTERPPRTSIAPCAREPRSSAGFPACGFWGLSSPQFLQHGTGMSREPADRNVCATTQRFMERESRFQHGASRRGIGPPAEPEPLSPPSHDGPTNLRGEGPQNNMADLSKSFPCHAGREADMRNFDKDCWRWDDRQMNAANCRLFARSARAEQDWHLQAEPITVTAGRLSR